MGLLLALVLARDEGLGLLLVLPFVYVIYFSYRLYRDTQRSIADRSRCANNYQV